MPLKNGMTKRRVAGEPRQDESRMHTRTPGLHEKVQEQQAEAARLQKQLQADYRNVFTGDAGARVLRNLFDLCGQGKTSVCGSAVDGTLDLAGTLHNEAMRKVYLHIRQFLDPQTLARVENNG